MRELFDAKLNETDRAMSSEALIEAVQTADVLVPTVTDRIDAELIAAAGDQLKLIASFGTGVDHIDLAAARKKGITVTNTPGVLTEDTADVAMALMLAVPRRIAEGDKVARSGTWKGWSPTGMLGRRINGKRLGIIGMGRIGEAIARRARGFGLSIHYHNRKRVHPETEAELEATYWESLDQMLSRVDIVSVNCPHTEATHQLLSRERLSLLQPTAYLVNTSRGEVIDEAALAELLADQEIAGAGLDVYADEPNIPKGLVDLPNVVLLPHIGSATIEGRLGMGEKVIINIQTFWDGHTPPDRVIEAML
jgi:glyoxylate reductase